MIISVSQLNNYIKGTLETDGLLNNIQVKGEVSNLQTVRGNVYFVLKDSATQIDCFSYSSNVGELINGSTVVANAKLSYYSQLGKISLFVQTVKIVNDKGEQLLKLLELKEKLNKQGCFSQPKKKINTYPKRIGVVSSATGAVIQDIIKVISRRNNSVDIVLCNTKVQGLNSDIEIAEAIDFFCNYDVDTVIVARGGGSENDLSAFNSEVVVKAINRCNKPVISAVGHQIDYTLCDLAADVRAATPSEAAEIATTDISSISNQIKLKINSISNKCVLLYKEYCNNYANLIGEMSYNCSNLISNYNLAYLRQVDTLRVNCCNSLTKATTKAMTSINILDKLSPLKRLQQGYAYLTVNGNKIKFDEMVVGQQVEARLYDGTLSMTINEIKKGE